MFEFICFDVLFVRVVDTVVPLVDMGVPEVIRHGRKSQNGERVGHTGQNGDVHACVAGKYKTVVGSAWPGSTRLLSALHAPRRFGLRARGAIARRARARGAS
jgi:hypothetical protein